MDFDAAAAVNHCYVSMIAHARREMYTRTSGEDTGSCLADRQRSEFVLTDWNADVLTHQHPLQPAT